MKTGYPRSFLYIGLPLGIVAMLLLAMFFMLPGGAVAAPEVNAPAEVMASVIYQESFETDGEGVRYTTSNFFNDGPSDHYSRTNGADISNVTGPYSSYNGTYFWAAEDTDDGGGDGLAEKTMVLNAVNISGYSNTQFKGLFGAGNESPAGASAYDAADYAIVYYSVDGGPFTKGLEFRYVRVADDYNEPLAHDTDFDGIGDGVLLGTAMQEFAFTIPSGNSVVISITVSFDSGNEEFGFDDFRIEDDTTAPDLTISKSAPAQVSPGETFTYTLAVTNSLGISTTGTVITDVLPISLTFVSASDGGVYASGVVSWTVPGTFTDGLTISRTFQATAPSLTGAKIVNDTYAVHATEWMTLTYGVPVTTTISPIDLIVTKTGPDIGSGGEDLNYSITIDNSAGVTDAMNVVVTDTLPISITGVISASNALTTTVLGDQITWEFDTVISGTMETIYLTATVDSNATSGLLLTNSVEAATTTPGDNPANNADQVETTIYNFVPIATARAGSDGEIFAVE
ncbi:MAG: DUF11 domain-containing protein, partial [Chloroflexi bacterium]|nr:DUF11 domain-containing protein [Chloroflexota bacterium]